MDRPSVPVAPTRPPSWPPLPAHPKRLDAALLAALRRRKREFGILPGLPFH